MSYEYSENILVQQSAANTLRDKLGWETVFAYDTEILAVCGPASPHPPALGVKLAVVLRGFYRRL